MSDLKNAIKQNGLKMNLGLLESAEFDPNCWLACTDSCTIGCGLGCFFVGLSPEFPDY